MLDESLGGARPVCLFLIFKQRKRYRKYFITVHRHFLQDIQGQCHSKDLCLFIERVETVKFDYSTSFICRKKNDNISALKNIKTRLSYKKRPILTYFDRYCSLKTSPQDEFDEHSHPGSLIHHMALVGNIDQRC